MRHYFLRTEHNFSLKSCFKVLERGLSVNMVLNCNIVLNKSLNAVCICLSKNLMFFYVYLYSFNCLCSTPTLPMASKVMKDLKIFACGIFSL